MFACQGVRLKAAACPTRGAGRRVESAFCTLRRDVVLISPPFILAATATPADDSLNFFYSCFEASPPKRQYTET